MSVVSGRYARALIGALSPDRIDSGMQQLRRFEAVIEQQPDARSLLLNPAVPAERRELFVREISGVLELDLPVQELIILLVERRRLGILGDLIESYRTISDEKQGIVRAVVTTVDPLPDSERRELVRRLETSTGKRVVMEVRHDSEIIGGLVVRIGSTVFDGSLRQQLAGFKARLLAGGA